MVPGGLDGEWQLLRTGLRQGPGRYPQERLVSGWLARERQQLRPLKSTSASGSSGQGQRRGVSAPGHFSGAELGAHLPA
jgi:hypothetical protein